MTPQSSRTRVPAQWSTGKAAPGERPGASETPAGRAVPSSVLPAGTKRLSILPAWPGPPGPADILLAIRLGIPPVTASRHRMSPAEYTQIGTRRIKTRNAHGYKEQALADYQEKVGWLFRQARVPCSDTGELGVYGVFHLPEGAGAADGDNLLKALTDAGNGICWRDDRQFVTWLARVVRGSGDPHTDLVVYRIPGGAA
jgi:Holliday junction resolvase RusA-like endonuclease